MTNMHDYSNTSSERTTSSTATSWTKYGRLVTKRIYVGSTKKAKQRIVILTLIFVDQDGQQFELKAINQEEKAYCVYRKVHYDHSYEIQGRGAIRVPDDTYSTSKYCTKIRSWWLEEMKQTLPLNKIPYKSISLNQAIECYMAKGKAVNMVGVFQALVKGPDTRFINDRPSVLGYYVILLDNCGFKFQVLIWHTPRVDKSNFAIFGAKKGDNILINECRSSFIRKNEPKIYTLTSLMQPVVNPPLDLCRF